MEYSVFERFRDLCGRWVFPQECIVCGGIGERPLCESCLTSKFISGTEGLSFSEPNPDRCDRCGRFLISRLGLCTACRTAPLFSSIDRVIPLFPYTGPAPELLGAWKTAGRRGLSRQFARCLAGPIRKLMRENPGRDFCAVPVPPRPGKVRSKGWDQIEELAGCLRRQFDLPVRPCLVRTSVIQQKSLNRAGRALNLKGGIRAKRGARIPEVAVLIDDLMTTGATLDACADSLKAAGCTRVFGLTLFFD